jgi:PAS domain-containing protein
VLWQEIISTGSVLSIFLVAWWLLEPKLPPLSSTAGKFYFGLLLGITTVGGMSMATEVLTGFRFDLRHAFIASSGLFAGPFAALVTGGVAALFRVYMGGAGMLPGVLGILVSAVIGGIGFYMMPAGNRAFVRLATFATCVTTGVLFSFFSIEHEVRYALLGTAGLPILTLTFGTTLCTTMLINQDAKRKDAIRLNDIYAAMVGAFPDCLNVKDTNGRFIAANDATAYLMRAKNAEDLIGKTDFDFYPYDIAEKFRNDELRVIESGKPRRIQQEVLLHTGERGLLATTKVPFNDARGNAIGLITHNQEITPSRSTQKYNHQYDDQDVGGSRSQSQQYASIYCV